MVFQEFFREYRKLIQSMVKFLKRIKLVIIFTLIIIIGYALRLPHFSLQWYNIFFFLLLIPLLITIGTTFLIGFLFYKKKIFSPLKLFYAEIYPNMDSFIELLKYKNLYNEKCLNQLLVYCNNRIKSDNYFLNSPIPITIIITTLVAISSIINNIENIPEKKWFLFRLCLFIGVIITIVSYLINTILKIFNNLSLITDEDKILEQLLEKAKLQLFCDLSYEENFSTNSLTIDTSQFNMNKNDNILFAKRNLVDSIYKSAHLEGISVTYPQTQMIVDGGNVAELKVDEVVTINNLKHAWQFMLNDIDTPNNFTYLQELHKIIGSNLIIKPGELRSTPVSIGGTTWKPTFPSESQIKEDLEKILSINNPTDRSITLMLWIMRSQMFYDGNKRVAMLFANKIMIENGCGIIEIPVERQTEFYTLLIEYYETNNNEKIKEYIYNYCIDGLDLD